MTTPRVDGTTVRKLREALGLSGADLCRQVEETLGRSLSAPHLTNIERHDKQPSPELAQALADALGVDLATITSGPVRRIVLSVEFGDAA